MKHAATPAGGEGRPEPFEVLLGSLESVEERQSRTDPLSGDETNQRKVDAARARPHVNDGRRLSTLVGVQSIFWRRSDDRRCERRRPALAVRPGSENRICEANRVRLRPGDVLSEGRSDADQIWGAGEARSNAHRLVGMGDAALFLREFGWDAQLLPLRQVRAERIYRRRDHDPRIPGEVLEELG